MSKTSHGVSRAGSESTPVTVMEITLKRLLLDPITSERKYSCRVGGRGGGASAAVQCSRALQRNSRNFLIIKDQNEKKERAVIAALKELLMDAIKLMYRVEPQTLSVDRPAPPFARTSTPLDSA